MPTGDEPPALRVRLSGGRDPRFEAALAALRVVVATPDEFDELDKAHLAPARARGTFGDGVARPELLTRAIVGGLASTPRATDRNERAALETLLRLADEAESALVADSGGASTANRRHALYYVDGQRRILRSVGEAARVRLARLNTG